MDDLENEIIAQLKELGILVEGLPQNARPLSKFNDYHYLDVGGKRVIFGPCGTSYRVRNVIPIPKN